MPLVQPADVAAITGIAVVDPVIAPAIAAADLIITEDLATSITGFSNARLIQIELYLAAHFAQVSQGTGPIVLSRLGEAEDRYDNKMYFAGIRGSQYGQQAIALDTSGILSSMAATAETPKKFAQFSIIQPVDDFDDDDSSSTW